MIFFWPYLNCFSYQSCDKKLTRDKILRNKTSTLKEVFFSILNCVPYCLSMLVLYLVSGRLKVNMGNIHFKLKNYPKAIKMYRMSLDQVPNAHREMR